MEKIRFRVGSETPRILRLFSAAQARKLSLSASLACAEGALKCHPRNGDGGVAIEVSSVSFVF